MASYSSIDEGPNSAEVVRAVFHNEHRIIPVSVCLDGEYGHRDTFFSVPCVLGADGIESIIELELDENEKANHKDDEYRIHSGTVDVRRFWTCRIYH